MACAPLAVLRIETLETDDDGVERVVGVDLLNSRSGFCCSEWFPAVAEPKAGGVWQDSPLAAGRRQVMRSFGNVIETFALQVRSWSPNDLVRDTQELRRLLEKAAHYWTTGWQGEPVWIVARGHLETNSRYAIVHDYRTPHDGFPYGEPFWSALAQAAFEDFELVLERGHWTSERPGTGACVEASGQQEWEIEKVLNPGFELAGGGPPTFLNWTDVLVGAGTVNDDVAIFHGGAHSCRIDTTALGDTGTHIYQDSTVTPGVTYPFTFWCRGSGVKDGRYRVYDVTNGADIVPITTTGNIAAAWVQISAPFVAPAGCLIVRIYFYGASSVAADSAWYDDISLAVTLSFGRAATCLDEVYVANKQNVAQLTHVFVDDGGAFGPNLLGAATPFNLFPAVPAIGDILYCGIDTTVADSGPFCSLVFDIGTAQVDLTIERQYWNGLWWMLTVQDNTDAAGAMTGQAFDTAGVGSIHWEQPSDWVTTTVNGVTGYWVRMRVSAVGGAPAPPTQQNRDVYTVTWGHFTVAADQVGGDIAALARAICTMRADSVGAAPILRFNSMVAGLRSTARGENFTAFLNIAGEQNPPGVNSVPFGVGFSNNLNAAAGRATTVTLVGGASDTVGVHFDHTIVQQYYGKYHAYVRAKQTGGAAGDIEVEIRIYPGGTGWSSFTSERARIVSTAVDPTVVDLGELELPGTGASPDDVYNAVALYIEFYNTSGGNIDVTAYDLILMPVDEWAATLEDQSDTYFWVQHGATGRTSLDVDSVSYPRHRLDATLRRVATDYVLFKYQDISAGEMIWQANSEQRLWILTMTRVTSESEVEGGYSYQLYGNQRYLSMRGGR